MIKKLPRLTEGVFYCLQLKLSVFLLAHSADAGDRHRYAKDDQDNSKRGEQVVGSSSGKSLLDLDDQGVNRRHQHEPEGDVEELVALLKSKLDPGSDAKKVKSSNHLIGSAEDGPDSRPSCDFLELLDAVDDDFNMSLRVDKSNSQHNDIKRGMELVDGAVGDLLDLITAKTRSRIQRGQQEAVDGDSAEASAKRGIKTDQRGELAEALRENLNRRKSLRAFQAEHHQSADGDNSDQTFDKHSAVTNEDSILLAAELTARRTGTDQAMETRDSAAGDHDEHGRPHCLGGEAKILDIRGKHRNSLRVKTAAGEHAISTNGNSKVQEVRSKVVTRLKQDPHGQDRSKEDIHAEERVPEVDVMLENNAYQPRSRRLIDLDAAADDQNKHDNSHDPQRHVHLVDHEARHNGQKDEQRADESDNRISSKRAGGHDQEDGDNEDQGQDREAEEKIFTGLADPLLDNRTDRVAVVTKRSNDRSHIVRTAEERRTDNAPQNRGQPAKGHRRSDRTGDGASAGDRSEVVSKKDCRVSGNKVNTVFELLSRSFVRVGKTVDVRHEASIDQIADDEHDRRNTKHHWEQHTTHLHKDLSAKHTTLLYVTDRACFPAEHHLKQKYHITHWHCCQLPIHCFSGSEANIDVHSQSNSQDL